MPLGIGVAGSLVKRPPDNGDSLFLQLFQVARNLLQISLRLPVLPGSLFQDIGRQETGLVRRTGQVTAAFALLDIPVPAGRDDTACIVPFVGNGHVPVVDPVRRGSGQMDIVIRVDRGIFPGPFLDPVRLILVPGHIGHRAGQGLLAVNTQHPVIQGLGVG